jgi:hypothetical protein
MATGELLHLPEAGGAMDQDDHLLAAADVARRVWYIHEYKPANNQSPTDADMEFTNWFLPEGYQPGTGAQWLTKS